MNLKVLGSILVFVGLIASTASATLRDVYPFIALPMTGGLIQQIPAENVNMFSADQIVKIQELVHNPNQYQQQPYQYQYQTLYFRIAPDVREMIGTLISQGFRISLYDFVNRNRIIELANQIFIEVKYYGDRGNRERLTNLASGFYGSEFVQDGTHTLSNLYQGNTLVVTTTGSKVNPNFEKLELGQVYAAFPDSRTAFKQMELAKEEDRKLFPPDEATWFKDRNKFASLYGQLLFAESANNQTEYRDLARQAKTFPNREFAEGARQMMKGSKRITYQWQTDIQQGPAHRTSLVVVGCEKIKVFPERKTEEVWVNDCINYLKPLKQLKRVGPSKYVCETVTTKENPALLREHDLQACLKTDLGVRYLLVAPEFDRCVAFNSDPLEEITEVDKANCAQNLSVYIEPQTKKTYIFTKFANIEQLSREELIRKIKRPSPENLYVLFEPEKAKENAGLDLKNCLKADDGYNWQTMKEKNGELVKECQPDTLYSWGPQVKLDGLKKAIGDKGPWETSIRRLYMARSPVTTFGYGQIPIRIKFKKGVVFKRGSHTCGETGEMVVYYRDDNSWSDWTVCSSAPIHSWSFGKIKHYDEMIKDYNRAMSLNPNQDPAGRYDFYSFMQRDKRSFIDVYFDGYEFKRETLENNLKTFLKMVDQKEGQIYFNPDLPDEEKTEEAHFRTDKPIYFNED